MKRVSVVVIDSSQLFREGLRRVVQGSRFVVIGEYCSLQELFLSSINIHTIEIVVLGVDATSKPEQLSHFTDSGLIKPFSLVILSPAPDDDLIRQAATTGVDAVLSKDISGKVLQRALELVMLGHKVFPPPGEARAMPTHFSRTIQVDCKSVMAPTSVVTLGPSPATISVEHSVQLSERESQILRCLVNGLPNKRIARELTITEATVKVHIKGLLRKLRATNRTQAAIWGVSHGYAGGKPDIEVLQSSKVVPLLRTVL